jgi:hypothetical protein
MVSLAVGALSLGKNPQYPLDRGRPQSRSERVGEEKIPIPAVNQSPVVQPVSIHYPGLTAEMNIDPCTKNKMYT